ncbi:MAG: tRNA pseudouridine 55 synthase [Planctomycetota bacterium]|nr:tRNA pseudouridine 55 synthase [Planctomycetota bacterium]
MSNLVPPPLCGILNLNKPIGVTSRDVVDRVSRPLRKVKVGHAGTLDPLASGVLVVCVGAATRLIEYVQRMPKTYRAVVRLGATSDTLDADGQVVERVDPRVPDAEEIRAVLQTQIGTISQMPPQFSALKVGGQRAYDLARAGMEAALIARPVEVYRIGLLSYEWPRLEIEIDCGSGTYIRSIARDVGEALGCGGLIEVLTRTRIGEFHQKDAIDPLSLSRETIPGLLRPAVDAVGDLPRIVVAAEDVRRLLRGQAIEITQSLNSSDVAIIGPNGDLIAIGEAETGSNRMFPRRVLATE